MLHVKIDTTSRVKTTWHCHLSHLGVCLTASPLPVDHRPRRSQSCESSSPAYSACPTARKAWCYRPIAERKPPSARPGIVVPEKIEAPIQPSRKGISQPCSPAAPFAQDFACASPSGLFPPTPELWGCCLAFEEPSHAVRLLGIMSGLPLPPPVSA
jgi:hypothetical protein